MAKPKRGSKAKAAAETNNVDTIDVDDVEEHVEETESEDEPAPPQSSKPGPASKKAAAAKKSKTPTKRPAASGSSGADGKRQRKAVQQFQAEVVEPKHRQGGSGAKKPGQEYEVEFVSGLKQGSDGKWLFEIKWKGYADNRKTWEPKANVANCKQHIKTFLDKAKGLVN